MDHGGVKRLGFGELVWAPIVFGVGSGLYQSMLPWASSAADGSSTMERFLAPVVGGIVGALVLGGGHWWLSDRGGSRARNIQQQRLRLIKVSTALLVLIAVGSALVMSPSALLMFAPWSLFPVLIWIGHRKRASMTEAEYSLGVFRLRRTSR